MLSEELALEEEIQHCKISDRFYILGSNMNTLIDTISLYSNDSSLLKTIKRKLEILQIKSSYIPNGHYITRYIQMHRLDIYRLSNVQFIEDIYYKGNENVTTTNTSY